MASILFLYIITLCYVSFYLFRAHFVLFLREQLVHRLQMQRQHLQHLQHLQPLRVVPPSNLLQNVHWYAILAPKTSLLDAMSVNVIKYRYELHTVTCL